MKFSHRLIGEQYIDSNYFDQVILKGSMSYPAILLKSERIMSKSTLRVLKNCFDLTKGDNLYIFLEEKPHYIGKLEVNIDNLYRLYNLFESIKLNVFYKESEESDLRFLDYLDFIHTIDLKIGSVSDT